MAQASAATTTVSPDAIGSRIESVDCHVLRVPLDQPLADSIYRRTHWHVPVVEVRSADGLVGTGYSGVWTGEQEIVDTIEAHVVPVVLGRDARDIARLWADVYWSALHWVGRAGIAHMAQGMVDVALWDLAAKRAGLPLWRLLGGRHERLDTYNTDGGWLNFDDEKLVESMQQLVDAGWSKVKMKIGGPDLDVDLARVEKVRDALDPGVTLMVDVNQRWDLITAKRALELPFDVTVPADHAQTPAVEIEGMARYRRPGASTIEQPLRTTIAVRSPIDLVSLSADPEVVRPGEATTLRATIRNRGLAPVAGSLLIQAPEGWSVDPASREYRIEPGAETVVEATVTNASTSGRSVTLSARATQGSMERDEASVEVFTGRLRCLLGSSSREDWHHDPGFGCVLDEGSRFEDLTGAHWPIDAVVRHCWAGSRRLRLHLAVPAGTSGTLRLFIADPDSFVGGRRQSMLVEGRDIGTFEGFQQGRWVEAPISEADSADGRIDVQVDNARSGSNVVVSMVEL